MVRYLFNIIVFTTNIASASPWMPWDKSRHNDDNLVKIWMPWNSNSQINPTFEPIKEMNNWADDPVYFNPQDKIKSDWYKEGLLNYYHKFGHQDYGYDKQNYLPVKGNNFPIFAN